MSSQQPKQSWQHDERHYCSVCNAWMGSDRQSILIHENGKKHQENVERALQDKRVNKQKEGQAQKFLADSLKQMEAAAAALAGGGTGTGAGIVANNSQHQQQGGTGPQPPPIPSNNHAYHSLPHHHNHYHRHHPPPPPPHPNAIENDCDAAITQQKTTTTYLEGPVFFGLLCEEMPVEIWSGPSSYSGLEKRLSKNSVFWKDSLVVAVVMTNNSKVKAATDEEVDEDDDGIQRPIIHVSYLKTLDDTEETIEKNVSVDRIRIVLGGDKTIPDTIEACRLLALGGEEVQVSNNNNNNDQDDAKMMEATGLSGWSTVTIKKTSILQESRDEKEKLKEQRRQVRADREAEQRRTEARRMEEAKVSNADDSALGAYDVWGKGEYKGIDISKELDCPIEETAKRLAGASSTKGKISFKKRTRKKGAGMARRKTSADDD
ncbi:hypothetical protein FRACYDRAFT_197165 [Fragilariopsis cylindrus CCMP1102]|uniref:Matrin-type domain-containing protein n=1 Tax=Fragilariopsis cylindrus CCMP1102 TaxID=635003 RepID=A0A1E7EQ31_9STRA|nr:hypothetical protein FRACYDRAFT_197165 [Fragilariopsis cylindrus CCMP1102]|eukprot:OEU07907.1 hypothetical protein FRACYDRAFT_197165 [Fragilariopsis cylindrus CCMP1102]